MFKGFMFVANITIKLETQIIANILNKYSTELEGKTVTYACCSIACRYSKLLKS